MSVLVKHKSIPKQVTTRDDLDFDFLRKEGIKHIETMGGAIWTDYNSHDPGITMLEMLCYAITDLGMRIDTPIENILSSDDVAKKINKQFYKASEILPTKPVNAYDYRKLFIDIDGVKNCWLRKYDKKVYVNCQDDQLSYHPSIQNGLPNSKKKDFDLKGLYKLVVDFEDLGVSEIADVRKEIRKRYHANRNLCEDLVTIERVNTHPLAICADIEVATDADEELVHATVLYRIQNYLATKVYFYSIQQMLEKGYTSTEIFEGPVLDNGFIDTKELMAAELRDEVRLSDIINIIMEVEGVKLVKDISLGNCDEENEPKSIICIDPDTKPVLCDKSVFNYNKDVLPLSINDDKVAEYLGQFEEEDAVQKYNASKNKELEIPTGKYSNPGEYTTIQNDFPDTYGITSIGIPGNPTRMRKALAKQLQGYLLFYDQMLASYFKHLEKINEILAVNGELTQTFFTQSVKDIEGLEELVSDYSMNNDETLTETLFEKLDNNIERRNRVLDHLISRFAERFTDYTFVMKTIYGSSADEIVLRNKEDFLRDYSTTGCERGSAFNYFRQPPANLWNTTNVSGVQKRLSRLLGILDYSRRDLSSSYVEIFEALNPENETVYRWRIRNKDNEIVLSATDDYYDVFIATRGLYFAVIQLIQTKPYNIEEAFEDHPDPDDIVIDNVHIRKDNANKYSYDVIDPKVTDTNHPDYIVATDTNLFDTADELKTALLEVIEFMKYDFTEEGIFLVEHMLLRPDVTQNNPDISLFMPVCTDECESCEPLDPYSYRVSIIIPGFTLRFYNTDFRNYMENIIRQEMPAHVLAKICWIGYREGEVEQSENDLLIFEEAWKEYLLAKTNLTQEQPEPELKALIESISSMSNVYPTGRLFDCEDEEEELSGKVILGKTNLGSL